MSDINYSKLRFLIADDFSNFRATVNGMLAKLGVYQVDMASNGADVLEKCQRKSYDVILCDYDLGPGRNGQQVLEELRFKGLISRRALFVLVSADAAKDVVMAAYDCEPDDYLMKPINARMLEQRVSRLLRQRHVLAGVYTALDAEDRRRAMAILIDLSITDNRHARVAQKMLGEIFIAEGELAKAEKLYRERLSAYELARLHVSTDGRDTDAIAAMPSRRPVKPRPSVVVALTDTAFGSTSSARARFTFISSLNAPSFGCSAMIVQSTFVTNQPAAISDGIYRQVDTIFLFNFTNDADLDKIAKVSLADNDTIRSIVRTLPQRHCLAIGKAVCDLPVVVRVAAAEVLTLGETKKFFGKKG